MSNLRQRHAQVPGLEVSSTLESPPKSRTLTWKEIPDWQRDNDYILTGYRQ